MGHKKKVFAALLLLLALPQVSPGTEINGNLKLGYVYLDEQAGDLSVIQESYNLYEDFSISQLKFYGQLTPKTHFVLNLTDINLDNRKAGFQLRMPGLLQLRSSYDQHRQVFDPGRAVTSNRQDFSISADVTPSDWLGISAAYGVKHRSGDRLSYPAGTTGNLGEGYDFLLSSGRIEGRTRFGPRRFAMALDFTELANDQLKQSDRHGRMLSVRAFTPCLLTSKLTHSIRAAAGRQELGSLGLDYTLQTIQYLGDFRPHKRVNLKYKFLANRIDDGSTAMKTDYIGHNLDGKVHYPYGSVSAGYSYETNDDHQALTSYDGYRLGGAFNFRGRLSAKIAYTNRVKKDEEKRTLLKESETEKISAQLSGKPIETLTIGARFYYRDRDLPDIQVGIDGRTWHLFSQLDFRDWGSLRADYTYAKNEYDDRQGSFKTLNHTVTSRIQIDYIDDLVVAGGFTYIDIGKDLDIEKSTLFFETSYQLNDRYHLEFKYDVYNFDDFVIVDRYYTANAVWINAGYRF